MPLPEKLEMTGPRILLVHYSSGTTRKIAKLCPRLSPATMRKSSRTRAGPAFFGYIRTPAEQQNAVQLAEFDEPRKIDF